MATATKARNYSSMTREDLYELAQERDIEGRSEMSKDELVKALAASDRGPNAVDLLIRQHREVEELFTRFEGLSGRASQAKADIVRDTISLLSKHAAIEEQLFYPAVRQSVPAATDDVLEDLEEHHLAELAMLELDHLAPDHERYDAKFTVLMENIRHHVSEEEDELFPKVRDKLDDGRLRDLGGSMQQAFKTAPDRPHPVAPDTPPGNLITWLPAKVWDTSLNLFRFAVKTIRRR